VAALAEMAATATTSSRVEEAGRMSSIEWEPKTLTLDQIKFARVSKHTYEYIVHYIHTIHL
jgi:7,8-dihydro-6-hydroxymethylpterin-pyrophosphokinase